MLVQLEFLKLTGLIEVPEDRHIVQMFWNSPDVSFEKYTREAINTVPPDLLKLAKLVEFKRTGEFVDIGYLRVPIYRLSKIE